MVVIANGLAGLWALAAHWLEPLRTPVLWWFTAAAQITIFIEVGMGAALVAVEDLEAPQFHTFYGFLAIIAVAILYSYRRQLEHRLYLLYGLGELFVMGLAIRAMVLHR